MNLSVGIITFNEEYDLPRTLESVKGIADEIVIVDSGSTDRTLEIARLYQARVYSEEWKGFGLQKNSVIDKCAGKWILLIDADEEISAPLKEQIRKIVADEGVPKVYKVKFTSFCFGKKIRHGGWSNFYRVRLFRNGAGRYDNRQVHENFITTETAASIKESINHYTFRTIEDYVAKFNSYTSKMAMQYFEAGKKPSNIKAIAGSFFLFLKLYIFQLGFLDGFEGYFLAKYGSLYKFTKYAKLKEAVFRKENPGST